ncbi:Disease resistance protein (CC-NBS-LRR class) family [Rhynchospora pubera]|uniref:Disease resistance protein (CC-NBS-LRR class) family n=1 Tax=Rhynchospora pubera TaxID=906938 RepID=A0AAV8C9C9_9POAL|nr:Disease resistance protein (CC-NBS-LRR class) family [Rhynchospora pubera]
MTESVVKFIVEKLGNFIMNEVQLLGGVGDQVKWAQAELTNIQCYLKDAHSKGRRGDAGAKNWLNQLRDVAHRIEDAIDIHLIELEDNYKKDSSVNKLKNLVRKPLKVPALLKLATEFDSITRDLEGICKSRIDYGIEHLHDTNRGEAVILPIRRTANQDVDETDVVGLDANKNNIIELLLNSEIRRRAVITIVGTGGRKDYPRTHGKKKKKIEQSLPSDEEEVDNYVGTLKRLLNRKRSIDVAKFADPRMVPYELGFLNDNDSRDLLLKKAQPDDDQLADLDDLPDALSKRCKGLPLALIVIGGILSTKNQSYHDWKRVLDTMDWHEEGIDCMKVLAMSYEDMPSLCEILVSDFCNGTRNVTVAPVTECLITVTDL